jgi:hypothetical protein
VPELPDGPHHWTPLHSSKALGESIRLCGVDRYSKPSLALAKDQQHSSLSARVIELRTSLQDASERSTYLVLAIPMLSLN